ncbi:hypothetical protein J7E99_36650 [Streptomyces sp. ISL-44]|uniref:hypothetical protein n=1 Tax=Streptomyces sp. ISL-44 TaxID=2819184 RepID=UPI001BEC8B24|nr:hypothetical protein [Streptomyces sp. ISL-44]MBT2546050.1 hypothetical protein [Streptomyces sp. ISL-44]
MIDGYDDAPLVPGEELVGLPGFWAVSLIWLCGAGDEDGEPEFEWFGADEADVDAACEALMGEERWPAFRIPFGDGHTALVVSRNCPDDPGTEYLVSHPDWDGRHGYFASIGPHQAGPGLSWRELTHIASTPDLTAPGIHDPDVRLLLLLPALGDLDSPTDATSAIAAALTRTGTRASRAPRLAAMLLRNTIWEPAHWTLPTASPLSGGGQALRRLLECDSAESPRAGAQLAQGITQDQSDRLARALGAWPA